MYHKMRFRWMEKNFLQNDDYSLFTGSRMLPALMIWGKDVPLDKIQEPTSKVYTAQGKNPICLMRTSWSDPNAIFLGFKTGAASVNHAHMDVGSFVVEADGVRWAMDFGSQNYESLESKGMNIFGRTQDAVRWTIFRMNNYSHNTLTFNDQLQKVTGYAKIDRYSDNPDFMNAVSDITSMYDGDIKKAVRGVGIKDQEYIVIKDEVTTTNKTTMVRWNMVTSAEVELTQNGAVLKKDGKTLFLKVKGPQSIKMKTWETAPKTDYDAENPGTIMVGFECKLPANTNESFEVILIPSSVETDGQFLDKNLDEW